MARLWTKEQHCQKQPFADVHENRFLENFTIFTGKHPCWSFFLIKLKKRLKHRCFPVNIAKFLKIFFLQNTSSGCFCILQVIVLSNIGPSRPSQHCVDCFPAKTCLCALGQHCTSSALVQCSFRRIRQHCTGKNLV